MSREQCDLGAREPHLGFAFHRAPSEHQGHDLPSPRQREPNPRASHSNHENENRRVFTFESGKGKSSRPEGVRTPRQALSDLPVIRPTVDSRDTETPECAVLSMDMGMGDSSLSPLTSLTWTLAAQRLQQDSPSPHRPRPFVSLACDSVRSVALEDDADRPGTPIRDNELGEKKRGSDSADLSPRAQTASPHHIYGSSEHKRLRLQPSSEPELLECLDSPKYSLSLVQKSAGTSAKFINCETLSDQLQVDSQTGEPGYAKTFDQLIILDVRWPYEYHAGHIRNATNRYHWADICRLLFSRHAELPDWFLNQFPEAPDQKEPHIEPGDRTCIVVHCEFSKNRGPMCAEMIRSFDRQVKRRGTENAHRLLFPQLYVLHQGFREFFHRKRHLCVASPRIPPPVSDTVPEIPSQSRIIFPSTTLSLNKKDCSSCSPIAQHIPERDKEFQKETGEFRAEWDSVRSDGSWDSQTSSRPQPCRRGQLPSHTILRRSLSSQLNTRTVPRQVDVESESHDLAPAPGELPGLFALECQEEYPPISLGPVGGDGYYNRRAVDSPNILQSESSAFHH